MEPLSPAPSSSPETAFSLCHGEVSHRPGGASESGLAQAALLLVVSQRSVPLCVNYLFLMLCFYERMMSLPGSLLVLISPWAYTDT